MSLEVVVLAAGLGKRMGSTLPKVLQPIAGRPMLEHVLETARALEPARIHVVYGHGGEAVKAHFREWELNWCHQCELLGTGHAVMQAMPSVSAGSRVLVLCGDVPLVRRETLLSLLDETAALAVLTAHVEDPAGYGRIVRDSRGAVTGIVEQKDASAEQRAIDEVNTGIMAIDRQRLEGWLAKLGNDNVQQEYYLTDIVAMAVGEGLTVVGVPVEDAKEVFGINDRAQLAATERVHQQRLVRELLDQGATIADPNRVDIRGELIIGADVFIDVGAVFEGKVRLGNGVRVGPYCLIRDSEIGDRTVIDSHCHLDGARTEAACIIGPFARFRPGAVLLRGAKAGNFVEIKKSTVGEGSKVNHLTYIGDATIGARVNVGAGTVVCNYDGANKHHTIIGEGAFIGSGAMLVAPVEIGQGATIAAGSTITKDTPPEKLTIARARQTTIDGWKRPVKKTPTDEAAAKKTK